MRTLIAAALLLLFCFGTVHAAEVKIAYVDMQKALNVSEAGKEAKEKINVRVKEFETLLDARKADLEKLQAELEKQSLLLSEAARGEKERSYQQKVKEFQRFTKDAQEELQQQDADFTRSILRNMMTVVQSLGKKEGYSLILEKTESSILYASESIDITDAVIKAFDAQFLKGRK